MGSIVSSKQLLVYQLVYQLHSTLKVRLTLKVLTVFQGSPGHSFSLTAHCRVVALQIDLIQQTRCKQVSQALLAQLFAKPS